MKFSALAIAILAATATAQAADSGRTADGCTYRILNGQYLTDCSAKRKKEAAELVAPVVVPTAAVASEPLGSYGDVPMRQNPFAPVPSVQTEAVAAPAAPETVKVPLRPAPGPSASALTAYETTLRDFEENRRQRRIDRVVERPYVSATIGSTTITNTESGSATGFGLNVGTLLDEHFGVEVGYTYAKQGLNLGLTGADGSLLAGNRGEDSALKSHLGTVELQGYVTNALRAFRPYLGLGFGFKSSTLTELAREAFGPGYASQNGSLTQTSLGGSASAGAKLRLSKGLSLGVAFRYFFPFARQDPRLEQPGTSYGIPGSQVAATSLSKNDENLTGSSQYQLSGGLQYAF